MHEAELAVETEVVRRLVADQLPQLASLPVRPVASTGTVNAVFRLGEALCVRLPRVPAWAVSLDREREWLPRLGAAGLPLEIPVPVHHGRPGAGYPLPWMVLEWIEGLPYADGLVDDECRAAQDLAGFVRALRGLDPSRAPLAGRRPLLELDGQTREAIRASADLLDAPACLAAWDRALRSPVWDRRPAWIHGDLLRPNLLVRDGRLRAVIDFGGVGAGDPATDVVPSWSVFDRAGRAAYRDALDVDDGTWERARGIALHQAALIVPYYRDTNPAFTAVALRTVREVLADLGGQPARSSMPPTGAS